MKQLPHILVTRHGRCVHNVPGHDNLWKDYSNDEIMGLTLDGIKETAVKARHLAALLRSEDRVFLMGSQSFRAQQTASLLASELRNKHGFSKAVWAKDSPLALMNEFPRPTIDVPLSDEFDFVKFKGSPTYDGGHGTFAEQFGRMCEAVRNRSFQRCVTDTLPSGPTPTDQIVVVSHHYVTSALIGAMCYQVSCGNRQFGHEGFSQSKFVEAAHKFYLQHDDVFYLTPLLRESGGRRPSSDSHLNPLWTYTARQLQKEILSPAGIAFHPLFSNDDTSQQPNPD